jgi:hypothetical protein
VVGLSERHTGPNATPLRLEACFTHNTTLVRQTTQDDREGAELRASNLLNGNPKAGNDAKMQDHWTLAR